MKLSHRAKVLLLLVDDHTEKDWTTGKLTRFFVPSAYAEYPDWSKDSVWVSGAGDANTFKGLENKGLIKRPRTELPNKYVYEITEEGRIEAEKIRSEPQFTVPPGGWHHDVE